MPAKMSKPKCALRGCKEHHTLMSKFCLKHIHNNDQKEESTVGEKKKKTQKSVAKKKASKKKAPKKKASKKKAPKKKASKKKAGTNKNGETRGNLGLGNGTKAQKRAAKAAALYPRIAWRDEVEEFKKGKKVRLCIELSTPGSAQVTRVRLVASDYCKGLSISTVGAEIIFEKGGA
jgi:hypothetical protein